MNTPQSPGDKNHPDANPEPSNRSSRVQSLLALPAAIVGLAPVGFCPLCYPALMGLLGAIGLGAYAQRLLAPLTIVLLVVALAALAWEARKSRDYRALPLGVLGAAAIYGGQFILASSPVKLLGVALLIMASFWNLFPWFKRGGKRCACADQKGGK